MIRIVQGNPGSGKSYYAVNYVADKLSTYDPLYKDHKLNDGVLIITNLENLRVHHLDFDKMIERFTLEKFLTIENFEVIKEKYKARHMVLIIDEAQKYLDSKFYNKDVFYFFQYHRHIGLDIFLLTQSVSTICRQLPPLCEFILEAAPRSKGVAGTFRYKFKDPKGTFMYSKAIRKKQETFAMYQSFSSDEAEKPKNVLTHWIVTAVVVMFVVGVGFKGFFYAYANKGKSAIINPQTVKVPTQNHIINPPAAPAPSGSISSSAPVPVHPVNNLSSVPPAPLSPGDNSSITFPTVASAAADLPTVVGFVGDGQQSKYLLSTGHVVTCKRKLSVGDVYIK